MPKQINNHFKKLPFTAAFFLHFTEQKTELHYVGVITVLHAISQIKHYSTAIQYLRSFFCLGVPMRKTVNELPIIHSDNWGLRQRLCLATNFYSPKLGSTRLGQPVLAFNLNKFDE